MSKVMAHTLYLALSIVVTWVWSTNQTLSAYNLQLTGALTLSYFAIRFFLRSSDQKKFIFLSTLILSTICLLLVFSTGGLTSPLFVLLNLLLFALALLFEPIQAATASVLLVTIFFLHGPTTLDTLKIVNLFSLILMTPVAIGFSRNYLDVLSARGKIKVLTQALHDTEEESLLWIGRQAKPSLASVLNSTTDLVMYFNSRGKELLVPPSVTEKLKAVQQDMITLYSSATSLEKSIEDESDKIKL